MRPESLVDGSRVVKGDYLKDERNDDAERRPEDQNLVKRKVENTNHL